MGLDDRIVYFLLGCVVGGIIGYVIRSLREIKEELDEVDEIVKKRVRNEDGFMRHPVIADIAVLLTVLITLYAAFQSQRASNEVQDVQDTQSTITECNRQYLSKTIVALNERTQFNQAAAQANVDLQKAQADFFGILLHKPPYSQEKRNRAAVKYFEALQHFIDISEKAQQKVAENPFPTDEELDACLTGK